MPHEGTFSDETIARHAEMLGNRVKKTFRTLQPRMERRGVGAFRLYDRDIPEVRAVVDWYEGHLVVGEYTRTQTEGTSWLDAIAEAAAKNLAVTDERVHVKRRRTRPTEGARYERMGRAGTRVAVRELGLRFWCNLDDFVDTGLFLDHRETRARVRAEAAGATFLNLYGYTGSFTCAAVAGGAKSTTTVDASKAYLTWAEDNLALNELPQQELVRAEVRAFLADARRRGRRWSLALLDPPSFSDRGALDVQRDHRALIEETLAVLAPGGTLYFSTNHQRFMPRLDGLDAVEITEETIPEDFRNRQVHRAWQLRV